MIRPPGFRGAAFGSSSEGDGRHDEAQRRILAERHGIPAQWAHATQVHGNTVIRAETAGRHGEADALYTTVPGLTLTVATADCVPIVLEGPGVAAVVHAGWRGAAAGVVEALLGELADAGLEVERAAIGPAIGPCCYEVGAEVASRFPGHTGTTRWETESVDLVGYVASRLDGLDVWIDGRCTYTDPALNSYRRNHTDRRQVSLAWIPTR